MPFLNHDFSSCVFSTLEHPFHEDIKLKLVIFRTKIQLKTIHLCKQLLLYVTVYL